MRNAFKKNIRSKWIYLNLSLLKLSVSFLGGTDIQEMLAEMDPCATHQEQEYAAIMDETHQL